MKVGAVAAAQLPPALAELDPSWSRLVDAPDHRGIEVGWHLLDNGVVDPRVTLLCVHGNPTWSYLWRTLLATAPPGVRVVAVDQLEMGFSERTGVTRRLADRIVDLQGLTDRLELAGPVITVAHDWGGPVSLGWGLRNRHRLAGVVLCNTAVHQPAGSPAPALIRSVRMPGVLARITVDTATFVRGTLALSRPVPPPEVRAAYLAPYRRADRRAAIAAFVEDIPLDPHHPSAAALDDVADGVRGLTDVPALLLWGPADPVFSDLYLHDLEDRLPHADVHRFVGASHLTPEDADVAGAVVAWIPTILQVAEPELPVDHAAGDPARLPLWDALDRRSGDDAPAVLELDTRGAVSASISFGDLHRRVEDLAAGLVRAGVRPGDRVALMIPPGVDLSVVLYACWRMGAVMVLVDAGLGPRNMSRALASAAPSHLIGIPKALVAAKALRWPGRRFAVEPLGANQRRALGVSGDIVAIEAAGRGARPVAAPADDDLAAVVFTSGSTGPSKGVVYRHRQLQAQRDLLAQLYDIGPGDRLVAAFAPFALYGPALGITSAVPSMDVTRPGTLTAAALGAAAVAVEPSLVFASPAALVNVIATADGLSPAHREALATVRVLLSAGAPIQPELLAAALDVLPGAEAHTPYGMTEVLPVADISLDELRRHGDGDGVCVGRPAPGVEVMISALDADGRATRPLDPSPAVVGEVVVRAAHGKDRYDRLWYTEHRSSIAGGWHRTGDVGHLDNDGRLWIGGRVADVITTADGPVTPVALEHAARLVPGVALAAAVGVGPEGAQVPVIVIERSSPPARRSLARRRPGRGRLCVCVADVDLADAVRRAVRDATSREVAAVLITRALPVDRRHNSKIDRTLVAEHASVLLAGASPGRS